MAHWMSVARIIIAASALIHCSAHCWAGASEPRFDARFLVSNDAFFPRSVAVADFNADGAPDFLVAQNNNQQIRLFIAESALESAYSPLTLPIPPSGGPWAVAAADLDGDGLVDPIYYWANPHVVQWLRRTGSDPLQFEPQDIFINGSNFPSGIVPTDLDLDGDIDIISWSNYDLHVHENRMKQGGEPWISHTIYGAPWQDFRKVDVIDFDEDGRLDFVTPLTGDDAIRLYRHSPETPFQFESIDLNAVVDG
ncbi:MAG: VCBS repeat-containing protein, partial [Candidatus Latescibacterota bacterium]|nr:VCBS repeat-containing protein [Candidatus Latescibacterota bacterium]